ncbi:MAG: hypothetical protein A3K19_24945 [Lentisphaerae bacterium RIFOXYB12_FULL_65_16]|nr:MAG: hypothetical protein A3K18_24875 [Lentisphaerae bacterium RIFOXYA12_64_32]OGV90718.1 MAG: hypothetical protein A3K19_24945 [Lentisphaerae bacterium RIFOXYB12_FULL_65_16]
MDFRQFTEAVLRLYQQRKQSKAISDRIRRGRSKACASEVEELVAQAVADMIPAGYSLLVDHPFSVRSHAGGAKRWYPDIAILDMHGTRLCGVVEIKADVSYTADNWVQASQATVAALPETPLVSYLEPTPNGKPRPVNVSLATPVAWAAVVVTGVNEHGEQLSEFRRHDDCCFLLMPKYHPNWILPGDKPQEKAAEIVRGSDVWRRMDDYFRQTYPPREGAPRAVTSQPATMLEQGTHETQEECGMENRPYGLKDTPISEPGEESLGLTEYAHGLVEFVKHCDTPMTIALQGDWGSGKTSLMNLIRKEVGKDQGTKVIWFNTWQYSQFTMADTLALSLLKTFIDEIEADKPNTSLKKCVRGLAAGGKFLGSLATSYATGDSGAAKEAAAAARGEEYFDSAKHIKTLKEQLGDAVRDSPHDRVVVFIDDLDRLVPVKAVELLESLKLFLDLPKCVYILAVDYKVVIQGLKAKFNLSEEELKGKSFFDKIIQVPFNMPVSQYQVQEYFTKLLDRIDVKAPKDPASAAKYVTDYVNLVNCSVGFNPRTVKRLFNSLQLLNMVPREKGGQETLAGADTNTPEMTKILFAILCLQQYYEPLYRYLAKQYGEISDETFQKLRDPEGLQNGKEFADLRGEFGADKDSAFYQRLGDFVDAFYHSVQSGSGNDETLSPEEINRLRALLSFSSVVSTEAQEMPASNDERYDNRNMANVFAAELNERYKTTLSPIAESFERGGFFRYQVKSTDVVDVQVNLLVSRLDLGVYLVFGPKQAGAWLYQRHKKSEKRNAQWAEANLRAELGSLKIYEGTGVMELCKVEFKPGEDTWDVRVERFKTLSRQVLDKVVPAFARAVAQSGNPSGTA